MGMTREQLVAIVITLLMHADITEPHAVQNGDRDYIFAALEIIRAAEKAVAEEKGA